MRSLLEQGIARSRLSLALINLVVLLGVTSISYQFTNQFLQTIENEVESQRRMAALNEVLLLVTDVETGRRGYVLTGQDRFLAPYEAAVNVLPDRIESLNRLLQDSGQQRRLQQLDSLIQKRVALATESIMNYQINRDSRWQIAISDRGKVVHDQIRALVAEMQTIEQRHLQALETQAQQQARATRLIFISGFGLSLLIFMLVYYLLNRQIAEREQAEEALRVVNRSLRTLSACNQTLIRATDESQFLQEICQKIVEVGGYTLARIELTEPPVRVEVGAALQHVTALAIPLHLNQGVVGNLTIEAPQSDAFQPDSMALLEELADDTAYGIQVLRERQNQQQTELALVRNEEQLRLALQSADIGIWNWDLRTGSIEWTESHARILGMELSEFDGRYETFATRVYSGDLDALNAKVERALQEKSDYHHEYRVVWPDGSVHWIEGRGRAFYDDAERAIRMTGTILDITERKQAELALQQAKDELEQRVLERTAELSQINAQLSDLYNNAPCGYHSLDAEGTFVHINDTELRWLGYSREALVYQKKFADLLTPESLPVFQRCFPKFKEQGWINDLEFNLICQDGSILPVALNATAVRDATGQFVMSRSTIVDIRDRKRSEAERKRAEAALKDSEERFRRAFDDASIGMVLLGLDSKFLQVNRSFCTMTGYSEAELLALDEVLLTHPDDRSRNLAQLSQLLNQEIAVLEMEKRYVHKQGYVYWVKVSASLMRNLAGEALYCIEQIQDITQQRAVEQMKNEFISIVSHELRTPLTSIHGAVSLLASGLLANRPDRAQRMLEIAALDTERLVRLVNDILDLERLDSGRTPLVRACWDTAELMQQSLEALQSLADQSEVYLQMVPPSSPVQLWVDRDRLLQTFSNLISNAIKFSPSQGTVRLTAELIEDGRTILFSVQDQGRGIPSDKLEAIFGRFQQVDASDSRVKGGTGLGLAICRSIVQQHGGKIWAESVVGHGSTFYVALPINAAEMEPGMYQPPTPSLS